MKKLLTLALFISAFLISTNVYSQSLGLGIEAGINIANTNNTPSINSSTRTGFLVGGVVDIGFTPTIGITTGMRYIMKGNKFPATTNTGVTGEATGKLSYLEFPVLLKVRFPLTEVKPYLIGGPTLGLKLASEIEFVGGGTTFTQDVSASTESIDFGLFFGGGIDFKIAPKVDLFIQAGYGLGLSNIEKTVNQATTPSTTKTTGIQITGGAKFRL
ncbi:MAG: porin family protein [bacterium]|nr:porin family protein [bacterium]